jgi:hypothetical protein
MYAKNTVNDYDIHIIPHGIKSHAKATGHKPVVCFLQANMNRQRVITFVDGFNLYHAIDRLKRQELKWLDLSALSRVFLNSKFEQLIHVFYFSAYASHMGKPAQNRQKAYVLGVLNQSFFALFYSDVLF